MVNGRPVDLTGRKTERHPNRLYQCGCCAPPRQIYIRLERPVDTVWHEHDHSPAVEAVPLRQRK
jgi:hypothetical protein